MTTLGDLLPPEWAAALADVLDREAVRIDYGASYLLAQCDHAALADAMRRAGVVADALVVDAPYSERTHAGHRGGCDVDSDAYAHAATSIERRRAQRSDLDYPAWTAADVAAFGSTWSGLCRGWRVSITDHVLSSAWERWYEEEGLYAFAPVAWLGATRPRLVGDGPSASACWLMVARPRTVRMSRWGTLRADYVIRSRASDEGGIIGGKPRQLMLAVVGDYSAPGDLVVDPCAGGGTTLVAAIELGRLAVGCEPDAGRYEIARARCAKARPQLRMALDVSAEKRTQSALDLTGEVSR